MATLTSIPELNVDDAISDAYVDALKLSIETGWIGLLGAFAYVSTDAHTFVMSTPADLTSLISPGARIRISQGTTKYFIVTAISATQITLYGGQNYALANAAIASVDYSNRKAPVGFPLDPTGWTETNTISSDQQQASPAGSTWYNPGGVKLDVPIGAWRLEFEGGVYITTTVTTSLAQTIDCALSTVNNGVSDTSLYERFCFATNNNITWRLKAGRSKLVALAAKTSYYLNVNLAGGSSVSAIGITGSVGTTVIRAVCAYL